MSFLLCLGEARFWSYAFKQWSLPEGFACFLVSPEVTDPGNSASSDRIKEAHQFWQDFFEAAWKVEAAAESDHDWRAASEVLEEIAGGGGSLYNGFGRLLAHCGFAVTDSGTHGSNSAFSKLLFSWLNDFFLRIGDTKCIEETHRIGREAEMRWQQANTLSCRTFYTLMQNGSTPLHARGVPH